MSLCRTRVTQFAIYRPFIVVREFTVVHVFLFHVCRQDAPATECTSGLIGSSTNNGVKKDVPVRGPGIYKYKCYSSSQLLLLREAPLFSKIPPQVVQCADVETHFNMLAVRLQR